jgi:hypothetical protein
VARWCCGRRWTNFAVSFFELQSEYDIAVIETQARRPVSVKVKQFSLQGARIQNDWQGPQMVKYKNKLHPWKYIVCLPVARNPIKLSSPNLSSLKPVHEGIRRVLLAQQRDRGSRGGGGGGGGASREMQRQQNGYDRGPSPSSPPQQQQQPSSPQSYSQPSYDQPPPQQQFQQPPPQQFQQPPPQQFQQPPQQEQFQQPQYAQQQAYQY